MPGGLKLTGQNRKCKCTPVFHKLRGYTKTCKCKVPLKKMWDNINENKERN